MENNYFEILNIDYFHQFTKGEGVKIATLDSEIFLEHPEFEGRNIHYQEFISSEAVNYHGTATSSLIVGKNIGVAPESELYHMKMLSDIYGSGLSWDKAMSSALRNKVDIISMSIGTKDKLSSTMKQMLQVASDRRIIICAPSGNEGKTLLRNPAENSNVVAVGGISNDKKIARNSNRDKRMEAYAPSEDILVANNSMKTLYSRVNGTSFANAIFAGQASLIISYARIQNKEIKLREFLQFYNQRNRTERKVLDMKKVKEELDIYLNL